MAETPGNPAGPIHFAGATLARYRHVCAFFHTRDEEYRVLLPFIREGFDRTQQTGQLKVLNSLSKLIRPELSSNKTEVIDGKQRTFS